MLCAILRSSRKNDAYIYVPVADEEPDLSAVPEALQEKLGRLDHVMDLDLAARKTLAAADPAEVVASLKEQGFYLQMPLTPEQMFDFAGRLKNTRRGD